HMDGAVVAQEVGGVEEEHVEGVTLDPLAAVDESSQGPQAPFQANPDRRLHGVGGAGLVGDRAYPADAGRDVGGLGEAPAAQECLEEPGWLEDLELEVDHF